MEKAPNVILRGHLGRFFAGHSSREHLWSLGPAQGELPELRVVELAPGPKTNLWTYATIGAREACPAPRLEFLISAPTPNQRHVELLSIAAWYHRHHQLGAGHTVPIGEPWLPGSRCTFFLVSVPCPFGPELEICNFTEWHLHMLWLLPITAAERDYKMADGLETLEQRFEQVGLEYWNSDRESAV